MMIIYSSRPSIDIAIHYELLYHSVHWQGHCLWDNAPMESTGFSAAELSRWACPVVRGMDQMIIQLMNKTHEKLVIQVGEHFVIYGSNGLLNPWF